MGKCRYAQETSQYLPILLMDTSSPCRMRWRRCPQSHRPGVPAAPPTPCAFSPREDWREDNNICIPKSRMIDPAAVLQRVDDQAVQNYISVHGAGKFAFQSYERCCATLPLRRRC